MKGSEATKGSKVKISVSAVLAVQPKKNPRVRPIRAHPG
jgi:hypothetical protein